MIKKVTQNVQRMVIFLINHVILMFCFFYDHQMFIWLYSVDQFALFIAAVRLCAFVSYQKKGSKQHHIMHNIWLPFQTFIWRYLCIFIEEFFDSRHECYDIEHHDGWENVVVVYFLAHVEHLCKFIYNLVSILQYINLTLFYKFVSQKDFPKIKYQKNNDN